MNKTLKIILISLASFVGLILLTILVAFWLLLTPARLTSIVRNQAPNFISCDFALDKVELTVVKSFPNLGLKIDNLILLNPTEKSPSDTLACIKECVVSVDIKKLLKDNQIIINECRLDQGYANIFINENGETNIDIFPPSTTDTTESGSTSSYSIMLDVLKLNKVDVKYTDLTQSLSVNVNDFSASAKGSMKNERIKGDAMLSIADINIEQKTDSANIVVKLNDLKIEGDANCLSDDIKADVSVSSSSLLYEGGDQSVQYKTLSFRYKGDVNKLDIIKGDVELTLTDLSATMANEQLLDEADIALMIPIDASLESKDFEFKASRITFNDVIIDMIGKVSMLANEDISVDMTLNTNTLIVEDIIELVPNSIKDDLLDNIDVKGELQVAAKVNGVYNENSLPIVDAEIKYDKGRFMLPDYLPYPISNFNTSVKVHFDMNEQSNATIETLNAQMSNSSFSLSGNVNDFMDKMFCDIRLDIAADLTELQPFIPDDIKAEGILSINADAKVDKQQLENMDLMRSMINAELVWDDMNVTYFDTINIEAEQLKMSLTLPNHASEELTNSLAAVSVSGTNIDAQISDMIVANLKEYNIDAQVSNVLAESEPMSVYADYNFSRIDFVMDDISFFANKPSGSVAMFSRDDSEDVSYIAVYYGDSLSFEMGDEMSFVSQNIDFNVSAYYDEKQQDILLQWNPHAGVKLNNAIVTMSELPSPLHIPSIDFQYDSTGIMINDSKVLFGNSDFLLEGQFTNVDGFLRDKSPLVGSLDLRSSYTDVNQIMDLFSGMGDTTMVEEEVVPNSDIDKKDEPFMVPLGIDVTLNTKIDKADIGTMSLSDLGGGLTVRNGALVLQEMGFTTDAATMMLTALYKSPRKNHLFLGMDLHLLEIDIAEMINIIPELDTMVPMLKSFAGNAEFHFAIETNLTSNYDPKISTLKGGLSIQGKDLVVLDNETFRTISKILFFKDKNHNKIDNLSVEITAFKNEIEVYPTLIVLDKYQALVGGRHKLDMTFNYSFGISNPWPFRRMGINVNGTPDKMKYKLAYKKNLNLIEPDKNKESHFVEHVLRLKNIIAETLKQNVNDSIN